MGFQVIGGKQLMKWNVIFDPVFCDGVLMSNMYLYTYIQSSLPQQITIDQLHVLNIWLIFRPSNGL